MDRPQAWHVITRERARLADLLDDLAPAEWDQPSLCAGWTVKHVAAHVISSPQATPWAVGVALVRARGSFDRSIDEQARRWADRPTAQIVGDYRRLHGSQRHPIGTTYYEPLLDVLVHSQDIAMPLQRPHQMPIGPARAAADRVWRRSFPFHARRRLRGLRLSATDSDWTVGDGAAVEGTTADLLLLVTGRRVVLPRLAGPGAELLQESVRTSG
ncbi:MAG TPA: maleylpyruvate isomerase family mycothiol-dependent enzyme [Actinomycetes bacterium]|nr:maleylpyruvate isomerase family mycothiol-dependent enzyme [Actinomycetes bacterium]